MIEIVNQRFTRDGIYVGRGTPLGNPFHIGKDGTREEVILKYRDWLIQQPEESPAFQELLRLTAQYKKDGYLCLRCHCVPLACHAEVIANAIRLLAEHEG